MLDRLIEAERRAALLREPEMCLDAALGREPTGLPLEQALPAVRPYEERVARAQHGRIEHLVLELMRTCALDRSRNELAGRIAGVEPAGLCEQRLAALVLELAPQRPGPPQKRHVVRMLVIGEPDDPREPAG